METLTAETKTLEAQPLSNKVALSSPREIDYSLVVRDIARIKTSNGSLRYATRKGKADILSLACQHVKSIRGIAHDCHLETSEYESIKAAIASFCAAQLKAIENFGTITVFNFDVPRVRFAGKKDEVSAVHFTANVQAERNAKDEAERRFAVESTLSALKRRLEWMDKNPSKVTGEQIREVKRRIDICLAYRLNKTIVS